MQLEKAALPALLSLTPPRYAARVDAAVLARMTGALGPATARAKFDSLKAAIAQPSFDVPALFHLPADTIVGAPFGFAPGHFGTYHAPSVDEGYFFENENLLTPEAVERKVDEMRAQPGRPLLLLPGRENACIVRGVAGRFVIAPPFYYPYRAKPVHDDDVTEPMCAYIRQRYHQAEGPGHASFGYVLWLPN